MGIETMTIKITRAVLCFAIGTAAARSFAQDASFSPRMGPITSEQETEIELVSQELSLDEFRSVSVEGNSTYTFDATAKFVLKNSSLSKKKPNVLIPLCTLTSDQVGVVNLEPKTFGLKVFVDGAPVESLHLIHQAKTVFARFSVKFNAKTRREVTADFKLFARQSKDSNAAASRPYTVFDYHFEDAAKWKGKVGFSRITVKMPYKTSAFNTHLFEADKPFKYKNRVAYYDKRKLDTDNALPITFFVVSPSFEEKVDRAEKRLKALPGTLKRRVQLADLLSQYLGAAAGLAKQLDVILKSLNKDEDGPTRKHQIDLFIQYQKEVARFEDVGTRCDETSCIEQNLISETAHILCRDDEACRKLQDLRIEHCCNPPSVVAVAEAPNKPTVSDEGDDKRDRRTARNKPRIEKPSAVVRSLEYIVAHWPIFLAVLIIAGWIYFSSRAGKRPHMKELE
jgi:hypothetical protein